MCLPWHSRPIMKLFCNLGLAPYCIKYDQSNRRSRVRCEVPKYLYFLICMTIALSGLYILNYISGLRVFGHTEYLIINLNLSCDVVRTVTVLVQCISFDTFTLECSQIMLELRAFFWRHLNHRLSYDRAYKTYMLKFKFIMLAYAQYVIGYAMCGFIQPTATIVGSLSKIVELMVMLTYMHIIFYIDMLNYHMSELNVVIQRDACQVYICATTDAAKIAVLTKNLEAYKSVHFRLWLVAEYVKRFFGWSLIAILLYAFADLVYSGFWFYESVRDDLGVLQMIRN